MIDYGAPSSAPTMEAVTTSGPPDVDNIIPFSSEQIMNLLAAFQLGLPLISPQIDQGTK